MVRRSTRGAASRDSRSAATLLAVLLTGTTAAPARPVEPDFPRVEFDGECASIAPAEILSWTSICNTTPITIAALGAASPYPSEIAVAGLTGVTAQVRVRLLDFSHPFSEDVDILLTNPFPFVTTLMSDAGSGAATSVDLDFQPSAPAFLPLFGSLSSGQYRPTDFVAESTTYPAPAPVFDFDGFPYGSTFAAVSGGNPNGTWRLWVRDDFVADGGSIAGGWCLDLATVAAPLGCPRGGLSGTIEAGDPSWPQGRPRTNNPPSNCLVPNACPLEPLVAGTYRYDAINGTNVGDSTACMTLSLQHGGPATCPGGAFLTVYSGVPDPTDLCATYLADAGSAVNATTGMGVPLSISLAPGESVTARIHEVVEGTAGCAWTLWIEANDCFGVNYPVFLDGFDGGDAGAWSATGP